MWNRELVIFQLAIKLISSTLVNPTYASSELQILAITQQYH